ncbi:MAG TPA: WG repeat-containing protein, partial [Bacteroidia bacterium]|nr:WG repeat-containing protein [Bacteroidia bacterium]
MNWIPVRQGGFWGYADTTRNIKITPQFDAAQPFKGKYAIIEKNKKAFAIDTTGKLLTPGFDQLVQLRDSVFFIYLNTVSDTLGGWGISTISGRLILLPAYDQVEELSPTLYSFRKGEAWGVVNMEGVIIVSPVYDSVYVFQRDFILLRKGKKFGLVSVNGNRLLPDEFVSIYLSDRNLFAALRKDKAASEDKPNGWGAVNESGALVVPFGQDTIIPVSFYFTSARPPGSDSLACFFPRAPGASTPAMYKSLSVINLFWIRLINYDGLCGVADSSGNMILPVEFKEIMLAGYGMW